MRRPVFAAVAFAACATAAVAQQQPPPPGLPAPRIQHAFPPGAKAGSKPDGFSLLGIAVPTANTLVVTGYDLDEPEKLLFSHPGITGEFIAPPKAPAPAADPAKKDTPTPPRPNNPNQTTAHRFKITVAPDVPPGTYDVRFVGKWGVSNPRAFVVSDQIELKEREPNNDVPEAQRIEIGTTISGVIANPTDVDYCVFAGKEGQRVVVACLASSIDSRARPMVEVFDASGRKLAANRQYKDADAVTDLVLPADGDYYVRLSEFTYQNGSPEHFYRLSITAAPWIDVVFPTAVEPGKPAQVTLYGRNLPGGQPSDQRTFDGRPLEQLTVTVNPPKARTAASLLTARTRIEPPAGVLDGFGYSLPGPGGMSNVVPIFYAREKVVPKQNAGGTKADTAEAIPAPCEVAGFLHKKGDRDWYSFDAKKGEVVTIEVIGERTGSAADFYFTVHNPASKNESMAGEQDDDPDALHPFGFSTRTGDPPPYRFTPPADGKFLVAVGCRESSVLFGPQTAYRLRVSPTKPDYRAVAMPYSRHYHTGSSARQGGTEAFDVFVQRIDGFNGAVTVTAEDLPPGVTARPVVIGPTARWGVLVLAVAADAKPYTGPFTVKTSAVVAGRPVTRVARPASVTWGVPGPGITTIARLDQSLALAVRPEKAFFTIALDGAAAVSKVGGKDERTPWPLVMRQGEKVTVPLKVTWAVGERQTVNLTTEPMAPNPQANSVTAQMQGQPTKDKPEATVTLDVKPNAPPGTYTVTVKGESQVPFSRDPMAKQKTNVPAAAFADPIEVIVIPSAVGRVSAGTLPNNTLKVGGTGEILVKVERLLDYAGEYTVSFIPPPGITGISAEEEMIPAGKNEAKLLLEADDDAKPGAVTNATIRVTALYGGRHKIVHEVKVTFTLAK